MTGKEALYNIELARITEYKKDGIYTKDIRDTTEYRVIKYELELLEKYKLAFEILKKKFSLDKVKISKETTLYFLDVIDSCWEISQEEYELLEELMKDDN